MADFQTNILLGTVLIVLAIASLISRWLNRRPSESINPALVRRFRQRLNAWWLMCAIMVFGLLLYRPGTVALFGGVSFWALREFITMTPTKRADHRALFLALVVFTPLQYILIGLNTVASVDLYGLYSIMIPVYASLILPAVIAIAGDHKRFLERTAQIQAGLLICVYSLSYAPALLYLPLTDSAGQPWNRGPGGLLIFFVLMSQLSEVFQWTWGQIAGKRLIAKDISTSRTWEGFLGGTLSTGLIGALLWWVTPFQIWEAACMSMVVAVMGMFGGLTMSAIKRDRGVNDYGTLVMGHAGVLDRIDTLCFAAPVFYHLTRFFFSQAPALIIDTHAHLTDPSLLSQLDHVLSEAQAAGVGAMLAVATNLSTSQACLQLAQQHSVLRATAGIHPNYTAQAQPDDFAAVCELAADPRVAAIGETGLDRHWDDSPWDVQVASFIRHIDLSRRLDKPLVIHTRDCADEMLAILREQTEAGGPFRAVMHSFTGPQDIADGSLQLGFYISFAGMLTYKNAADLREIAATIPLDRLLVETDCPYLTPHPYRGQRPNRPALVVHTLNCLADVHRMLPSDMARITTENAQRLFGAW